MSQRLEDPYQEQITRYRFRCECCKQLLYIHQQDRDQCKVICRMICKMRDCQKYGVKRVIDFTRSISGRITHKIDIYTCCSSCGCLVRVDETILATCCGSIACFTCAKSFRKCVNSNNDYVVAGVGAWFNCQSSHICHRCDERDCGVRLRAMFGPFSHYTFCRRCIYDATIPCPLTLCLQPTNKGTPCQSKIYPGFTFCRYHS